MAGANPNLPDRDGDTVLHKAINKGCSIETVQVIVGHGAHLDVVNKEGAAPLLLACRKAQNECIKLLLEVGADATISDGDGNTCLHKAVDKQCDKDTVHALVDHGAPANAVNKKSRTALILACLNKQMDLMYVLLDADTDPNISDADGDTCLHIAVYKGFSKEILQAMIDHQADVNAVNNKGYTALALACKKNQFDSVKILLNAGADANIVDADLTGVNDNHETLLFLACKNGAVDVVQMLLDSQQDIRINFRNIFGASALSCVCNNASNPDSDSVSLLSMMLQSEQPIDVDSCDFQGKTPLHVVCQHGNLMMANMLLRASRRSVNAEDAMNRIPLHYARTAEFVRLLVDFGADVNKRDVLGQTPLLFHCQQGNREVASALIKLQSSGINSCDHMRKTVVHMCTASRILDILQDIKHLPVNDVDINRQTALHFTVMNGDLNSMQQLLNMGADLNIRDKNNLCPLHLASDVRCFELLVQNKADTTMRSVHGSSPDDMKQWYSQLESIQGLELWHDIVQEGHTAVTKIMTMPLFSFVETDEQHRKEYQEIESELMLFMKRLCEEIQNTDPLMECEVILSGSLSEDTAVSIPSEVTFICTLTQISQMLRLPKESSKKYFTLKLNLGDWPHFVDCYGHVNAQLLLNQFYNAVQQALSVPSIWMEFSQFYRSPVDDIMKNDPDTIKVKLIWHGSVYKWLPISVDIFPGLLFPSWKPSWCESRPLLLDTQCYFLAKGLIPCDAVDVPEDDKPYLFSLDFTDAEAELFRQMAPELKDGFKLAKLMRQPCICPPVVMHDQQSEPATTFITSDMLKNVTFQLHEEVLEHPEKLRCSDDSVPAIVAAQRIYSRLSEALHKNSLEMYMVPTHDILHEHFQSVQSSGADACETALAYCQSVCNMLDNTLTPIT